VTAFVNCHFAEEVGVFISITIVQAGIENCFASDSKKIIGLITLLERKIETVGYCVYTNLKIS
jgi:hypothetical protein